MNASTLPLCVFPGDGGCSRRATRGVYGPAVCYLHSNWTSELWALPRAPGLDSQTEIEAQQLDAIQGAA